MLCVALLPHCCAQNIPANQKKYVVEGALKPYLARATPIAVEAKGTYEVKVNVLSGFSPCFCASMVDFWLWPCRAA